MKERKPQWRRWELEFGPPAREPDPVEDYRAAEAPQPEPKVLRNIAWSLPPLVIVVLVLWTGLPLHNAALLGLCLVGLIAGAVLLFSLPWAVKQSIRR